jgi:uncharacterized protein YutE (UPF0331/DUF86 family)
VSEKSEGNKMKKEEGVLGYGLLRNNATIRKRYAPDRIYERLSNEISELSDERSKTIVLHLYVEYWLNKLIQRKMGIKREQIERLSFYKKAKTLRDSGVLDDETYQNTDVINGLRNIYAHELELESQKEEIREKLSSLRMSPYFVTTDKDNFRAICLQTMFSLEAIYNNNCSPVKSEYPQDRVRRQLIRDGEMFWQECEILSREEGPYGVEVYKLKCPLCGKGTIIREHWNKPGFRESEFYPCRICNLGGDGSQLILRTAKEEYWVDK